MTKQELIKEIEKYGTIADFFKWAKIRWYHQAADSFKNSKGYHWAVPYALEEYKKVANEKKL